MQHLGDSVPGSQNVVWEKSKSKQELIFLLFVDFSHHFVKSQRLEHARVSLGVSLGSKQ